MEDEGEASVDEGVGLDEEEQNNPRPKRPQP